MSDIHTEPNANGGRVLGGPSVQATNGPEAEPGLSKVYAHAAADFRIGCYDSCGRYIKDIYFKRTTYIIYCSVTGDGEKQVLVRYADDNDAADKQIAEVAELIPLRNKLQGLLENIPRNDRYFAQIAEAFRLGLEHKIDVAKQALKAATEEAQNVRDSNGRNTYINKAAPYAGAAAAALLVASAIFLSMSGANALAAWSPLAHLSMAAAAGALGALLSISLSVRARTVATDGDSNSIKIDALVRILIGVISAVVLYLIVATGVLATLKIGDMNFSAGTITWKIVLLLGFAAGFLERLVPDLLEKKAK